MSRSTQQRARRQRGHQHRARRPDRAQPHWCKTAFLRRHAQALSAQQQSPATHAAYSTPASTLPSHTGAPTIAGQPQKLRGPAAPPPPESPAPEAPAPPARLKFSHLFPSVPSLPCSADELTAAARFLQRVADLRAGSSSRVPKYTSGMRLLCKRYRLKFQYSL